MKKKKKERKEIYLNYVIKRVNCLAVDNSRND